ncbi:ATP-binding protein [Rossellomorea aquimaris]|uniref:ATP-binding protein n=1 Tax=Rossellomorea aquimaris TaxID=189382 RepID=UPI001CD70029|nr:ATP-binding protein [Rossellomorea aquimaris]MCA1058612.1 ATP-binding protein [Rossellomorea aquimaris]
MIDNRDVLSVTINEEDELIIASDCSGGIGTKTDDVVRVDPEVVGYFSFRVAAMECLAVGACLRTVQLMNFTSDAVWEKYTQGVRKGLSELDLEDVPITGSSESNFSLNQSALGVTCIGIRKKESRQVSRGRLSYALIGTPLVGDEVLRQKSSVAPLALFKKCIEHPSIFDLLPVGSKGVRHELSVITGKPLTEKDVSSLHDLEKSSGPATSFIIAFQSEEEPAVRKLTESYYSSLRIN